jgi:PAS domain S-box-containing protein
MKPADGRKRLSEDLTVPRWHRANRKALVARAEQAEDELASFFDQSADLLCVAGLDGYFRRLNSAWPPCLGWSVEELTASPFLEFVHPDDREATMVEFAALAGSAPAILFENRYRHRDGSYHWLRWNARSAKGGGLIYATVREITRQKLLEREILEILDREKERLGRELHDGLCQSLAGIAALSSALSRRLATNCESAAAAEVTELLKETIGQARDLARGLGPVDLNKAGLAGALETLALNVRHLFHVSCTLEFEGPFPGLRRVGEAHLFRIAQQAVNNAIAHGRADKIEISLNFKDGKGILNVRDDGVGLPEEAHNRDGIGLYTMDYRARLIGGSLEVRRQLRRGSAVTCVFPLPQTGNTSERPDHGRNNT